jgi:predicted transcriptional regulator
MTPTFVIFPLLKGKSKGGGGLTTNYVRRRDGNKVGWYLWSLLRLKESTYDPYDKKGAKIRQQINSIIKHFFYLI